MLDMHFITGLQKANMPHLCTVHTHSEQFVQLAHFAHVTHFAHVAHVAHFAHAMYFALVAHW